MSNTKTVEAGEPETQTVQTVKQTIWSEMSDGQLRYQLDAFERHNDVYGADYRQLVRECRGRDIYERGNWRDQAEGRAQ